jgi:hypothetical protein
MLSVQVTYLSCEDVRGYGTCLTLSLTRLGPFGPSLLNMKIPENVLKVRYRQKIGIPQAGSWACFEITTAPILDLISL